MKVCMWVCVSEWERERETEEELSLQYDQLTKYLFKIHEFSYHSCCFCCSGEQKKFFEKGFILHLSWTLAAWPASISHSLGFFLQFQFLRKKEAFFQALFSLQLNSNVTSLWIWFWVFLFTIRQRTALHLTIIDYK